jgi:hypothetical protein
MIGAILLIIITIICTPYPALYSLARRLETSS